VSGFRFGPLALAGEQWARLLRPALLPVVAAAVLAAAGLARWAPAAGLGSPERIWVRELAPLVAALVAAARLGAALAGELGAMRATDQVDALRTLAGDPWRHLVLPRLIAAAVVVPTLAALADGQGLAAAAPFGVGGGALPGVGDVLAGLVRSSLYGVALAAVGCAVGLAVRGGAREVGAAAARAAAASVVAVLGLALLLGVVAPA